MPVPLIDLQRRLTIVGAIRIGGEKKPNRPGEKLEAFRLTSPKRELVDQAAALYGGEVSPWESNRGAQFQVYTTAPELPVLVMPGYSMRQTYELWEGATKRLRVCDGIDDDVSGGPCVCNAEGVDRCDIYTRLVVALPELDTALGWQLITKGANAAHELPTMMRLVETVARGSFVPARLRLDQRRSVGTDGQVHRFVVPTLDLGVGYLALAAGETNGVRELSAGEARLPSVHQAIEALRTPIPDDSPSSRLAPLPPDDPLPEPAPIAKDPPLPDDEQAVIDELKETLGAKEIDPQTYLASDKMKDKLNVLVGQLRDAGHIKTADLWLWLGTIRTDSDVAALAVRIGAIDADGTYHWAPLREVLTRPEANQLIDRLERFRASLPVASGPQGGA